jgi:hypothetical protein
LIAKFIWKTKQIRIPRKLKNKSINNKQRDELAGH